MIFLPFLLACASAYVQLNFTKHRGNSRQDMGIDKQLQLSKRDDELVLENFRTFYLAEIFIGSENLSVGVLVDTGSSDLWVAVSSCSFSKRDNIFTQEEDNLDRNDEILIPRDIDDSPAIQPRDYYDCNSYGNFDPQNSTTFTENVTAPPFEIAYLDKAYAEGFWGSDYVTWDQYRVNLTFAVAEQTNSQPVFGIGFPLLEALVTNDPDKELFVYPNFPLKLYEDGLIDSWSYAISLGRNNVSEGQILFGAIDHGKYEGQLQKVKMVNTYGDLLGLDAFNIILDGISGDSFLHRDQTVVLLDSGSTGLLLPELYLEVVQEHFDLEYNATAKQYEIDCSFLQLSETISFWFSGIEIEVPMRDMVFQSDRCWLSFTQSNTSYLLGDDFLKNAYVVYDLGNEEIALAQAAAEERPETIEAFLDSIPLALDAPFFTYTALEEFYTTADGYFVSTTKLVQNPLYEFPTLDRSSYDLGNTTYETYTTDIAPEISGSGVGPVSGSTSAGHASGSGHSSSKTGGGSRNLALGVIIYNLAALAMWI